MKKKYLIISALIIVAAGSVIYFSREAGEKGEKGGFCTTDALLCPDSSGVGRRGEKCAFAACPNKPSFTGELWKDGNGYKLIMPSPVGGGVSSATYSMPLLTENTSLYDSFLKKRVTVRGVFTEGNTLNVVDMTEASASEGGSDAKEGSIGVGETKLISGVKITLNSIVADSRCPAGVQCIQAGWVTANVSLLSDTDKETVNMNSNASPKGFDSFLVSIVDVTPKKTVSREIAPSDYRIMFRVDDMK